MQRRREVVKEGAGEKERGGGEAWEKERGGGREKIREAKEIMKLRGS